MGIHRGTVIKFQAVDGRQILARAVTDTSNPIPITTNDYCRTWDSHKNCQHHWGVRPRRNCQAHPGECGQALSHIAIWRKIAHQCSTGGSTGSSTNSSSTTPDNTQQTDECKGALILEDDFVFARDFALYLQNVQSAVGRDWDILYLGFVERPSDPIVVHRFQSVTIVQPKYIWVSYSCLRY